MPERGTYTVIEGGDGVGKSTVVDLLAKRNRLERGVKTFTVEEARAYSKNLINKWSKEK